MCADIQESGEPRVDRLIQQEGGAAVFVQADVSQRAGCDKMVAAALDNFGAWTSSSTTPAPASANTCMR